MKQLHAWLRAQFEEKKVEPNSGLGAAHALPPSGRSPTGQQSLRKGPEEGDSASEEFTVLQDRERRGSGRPLYEPDPHLRIERCQSFRLPHRVAETR